MRIVANDENADRYRVIDCDTGKAISNVLWADAETGEYAVIARDEEGFLCMVGNEFVAERRRGNIELRETA